MARRIMPRRQLPSHRRSTTWSGKELHGAVRIDLSDLDFGVRLAIDAGKLKEAVGRKIATRVKKSIRHRQNWDGSAFPEGVTLRRTGSLYRAIKYARGVVGPDWWRRRADASKKSRTNYGVLAILISTSKKGLDPLGGRKPDARTRELQAIADEELAKQWAKGDAGLVKELRRTFRRGSIRR